ncbi:MAG: dethiobiotin synthase [Limisphaerales bacterium]
MSKVVFVTGTDTGAGKTVLTALLLRHLLEQGVRALAMKPFCSGGREDAELLHSLQGDKVTLDEVNPFYFTAPLAPWAAVKREKGRKQVSLKEVSKKISDLKKRCDVLLIEGSGGLLVPLGANYTVLDLIAALKCEILVVGKNQLGTINHTLLSLMALQRAGAQAPAVVLMACKKPDFSAATNLDAIKKWGNCVEQMRFFELPYLGKNAGTHAGITRGQKKVKKVLAGISECI